MIQWLRPDDLLVINNTKVFPARLHARKSKKGEEGGGAVELLLLRPVKGDASPLCWEVLVKGNFSDTLTLHGGGRANLIEEMGQGKKKILFELPMGETLHPYLEKWGEIPIPPYILRRRKMPLQKDEGQGAGPLPINLNDADGYQTVYAERIGSIAAPTAGLHFTKRLIAAIQKKGIRVATITLHVGTDTFQPISVGRLDQHKMSGEWFEIPDETVYAFAEAKRLGGRIIAVGTSVMRALESASDGKNGVSKGSGETDLFITPGYRFRAVDLLITNLHPPRSTGLVLVSAFAGHDHILDVYQKAMEKRYRFFTYGDAMLIV
jgi:S-adenosylmethionine:tRNA ribosyltransferase-isomerase